MGGNAFAHAVSATAPTLSTPRMTPEKYTELKGLYETKLRKCLPDRKINIMKEAPEKTSYGDLDFLVESSDERVDWLALAGQLGVAGVIINSSGKMQSCSFAVPIDGSPSPKFATYKHEHNPAKWSKDLTSTKYAQLDLEVVPQELFEWHCFYSSYGDMSGLLGHMVHNLGFTMCDKGLMLRLAEMEATTKMIHVNVPDSAGRLFLSKDPQQVMLFLGLSFDRYQKGFTTVEEFYQWLSQCKLLSRNSVKIKKDDANARQKEQKRPLYNTYFTSWLPAYLENHKSHTSESQTPRDQRQDLLNQAVEFFVKKAEYEQLKTTLIRQIQSQTVESFIKPIIAQHSGLQKLKVAETLRGFRRWVSFNEDGPYILTTPHDDEESELQKFLNDDKVSLRDEKSVDDWVKENWEVIKGLERERVKALKLPA